jgi:DNA-binding XRE family transcriptional regulator
MDPNLLGDRMPLFKTRLRVLRAEREWSQARLAAQVGVTRQTINSIEKGRFHPNLRHSRLPALLGSGSRKCSSTTIFEGLI